ncbi:MAG TPA: HAD-IA family hydrolase [Beijerinckiaceae bacterium]|jgi:HAD superfamily hydrolase (TIGR01509 family)
MELPGAPRIRLVVFDCDGVLVDSEALACGVEAQALTALGHPITGEEVARRYAGMSDADMRRSVEREIGRALPPDHGSRCAAALEEVFRRELRPVEGMAAVVDAVTAVGVRRCVASSSGPERLRLALTVTGLWEKFAPNVFSARMVARGKPAPDLFLFAAEQMGTAPAACLVVEDSVPGVLAARAAGMTAVGFAGGGHCGPDHAARLWEAGADRVCADTPALAASLRGFGAAA